MLDLRIVNAIVVGETGARPADIGIEGSAIAEVEEPGRLGPARSEVDAAGLHAMPGAIDVHFHCRAPGHPQRGDFASETGAAAAGGVTTVFEMPISDPACSTPDVFRLRRALVEAESYANVALYAGAAVRDAARAAEMAEHGAIGFKLFTVAPAEGREAEFDGLWAVGDGPVYAALEAVAGTGLPCVVHAESESLIAYFESLAAVDEIPPRPPAAEAVAIASTAALAKEAGTHVHIAHVSSRSALDAVRGARAAGALVTAETCPQYLLLDERAVDRYGALAKIAPPLRTADDSAALWRAVADGELAVVASDHSPFLAHEKLGLDYARAPQGLPTVELLVPTMLDAAARGVLSLESAVALVTAAPARLFGLDARKGVIAVGADADITLFSLHEPRGLRAEDFHTRANGCAVVFEELSLGARIEQTIVNGRTVFERGRIVADPAGRFTAGRAAAPAPPERV
jgi:dihydroorotase (multifunctional complex type)